MSRNLLILKIALLSRKANCRKIYNSKEETIAALSSCNFDDVTLAKIAENLKYKTQ